MKLMKRMKAQVRPRLQSIYDVPQIVWMKFLQSVEVMGLIEIGWDAYSLICLSTCFCVALCICM